MNELENLMGLIGFSDIFNNIPEGTDQNIQMDNLNIHITKKNGDISVEISELEKAFDDTATKKIIKEYKERIEELDDCLFVEAAEEMGQYFDVKRFDELLNQDTFTEEEAAEISEMIDQSSQIICDHLEDKINELVNVYNRF